MVCEAAHEAPAAGDVLARVHREEHSRLLATLVRRFGDLELAEDAAQEAMEAALRTWPERGVPQQPLAWLITTARRAALDRVRRDATYARRLAELHLRQREQPAALQALEAPADVSLLTGEDLPDDRLAMLMSCCHPALAPADRIALMLRYVGALSTAEVATALLVPVPTMAARLTRAKKRLRTHRIRLTVPEDPHERERRLPLVFTAISLVFTEGYAASSGDAPIRRELTGEAIRLARIVHRLVPTAAEPQGLLALLLLTEARSAAREDADGVPIALEDQDRGRWDRGGIVEGLALAEEAAGREDAGRFTVQAAIAAVHTEGPLRGHRLGADRRAVLAAAPTRRGSGGADEPGDRGGAARWARGRADAARAARGRAGTGTPPPVPGGPRAVPHGDRTRHGGGPRLGPRPPARGQLRRTAFHRATPGGTLGR